MTQTSLLTAKDHDAYKAFLSLNSHQQRFTKLLAVIYKPISRGHLNRLFKILFKEQILDWPEQSQQVDLGDVDALTQLKLLTEQSDGYVLQRGLANILTKQCISEGSFTPILRAAEHIVPVINLYEWERSEADTQRLIRDFLFLKDYKNAAKLLALSKDPLVINHKQNQILVEFCFFPFELEDFLSLPDDFQYHAFSTLYYTSLQQSRSPRYVIDKLQLALEHNKNNTALSLLLGKLYLVGGNPKKAKTIVQDLPLSSFKQQIIGTLYLCNEDYENAYNELAKASKNNKNVSKGELGLITNLAKIIQASTDQALSFSNLKQEINKQVRSKSNSRLEHAILFKLSELTTALESAEQYISINDELAHLKHDSPCEYALMHLVEGIAQQWCNQKITPKSQTALQYACDYFEQVGLELFKHIAMQLLGDTSSSQYQFDIRQSVIKKPKWHQALEKLQALGQPANNNNSSDTRLIWEIIISPTITSFKPREQKRGKTGWGKGRHIGLGRLFQSPESFGYLSEQDKLMCKHIKAYQSRGMQTDYILEGSSVLRTACDAPNIYLPEQLETAITLTEQQPELVLQQLGDEIFMSMPNLPFSLDDTDLNYTVSTQDNQSVVFSVFEPSHLKIAKILGDTGLVIPLEAKQQTLSSIKAIAPLLNIQSNLPEIDTGTCIEPTDTSLVINIQPYEEGLSFTCIVLPLGEQGPAFKPGVGHSYITALIGGKRLSTHRELTKEQSLLESLDVYCPAFLAMADNQLQLGDIEAAYEALGQLEQVATHSPSLIPITLRWPKGQKVSISKTCDVGQLQLAIYKKNQWFDISGELKVSEDKVIDMKSLLELCAQTHSRFVQLEEGDILSLSSQLKQQLDALSQITDEGQFHPLLTHQVLEATTGMRMKTLHAWEKQAQKMHEAQLLEPSIPPYLNADLRAYQAEGIKWALKLAHWGAGACLADDMGLGKTLQALAVILARSSHGPTLIIAPSSVCFNWQQEANKFAPSLEISNFSQYTILKDKQNAIEQLRAGQCIIVSYALLQRHADLLSSVTWQTIVADEAQALKNPLAKRTKAAYQLKGHFKLITTGTPIENNLTELWSLFRFVNPGLLGNLKRFSQRFSAPIENAKDDPFKARTAAFGLKTMLQPFVLRRMKEDVAKELPAKTEINLSIELSEAEATLYEGVRAKAIESMSDNAEQNQAQQRIKLLSELTKLRQACCHPDLVAPHLGITSSKLARLSTLLEQLKANNHKVLIFSQFVGHLQLIKPVIESLGLSYQYLDGSTPQSQRQQSVNAFQRGEYDVFLISLKAGGSGLNLTAADYVIHMDPWWNPAVEDQASDRAHRIGQTKPVTVYRLIAKNTIEEKILSLHQHKKDLAERLLAGTGELSKLSVEEIIGLLKETF